MPGVNSTSLTKFSIDRSQSGSCNQQGTAASLPRAEYVSSWPMQGPSLPTGSASLTAAWRAE